MQFKQSFYLRQQLNDIHHITTMSSTLDKLADIETDEQNLKYLRELSVLVGLEQASLKQLQINLADQIARAEAQVSQFVS